jgi:HSP20 family molecular chaperone IbpA
MALSLFYPDIERDLFWAPLRTSSLHKTRFYDEDENCYSVTMNVCGRAPSDIHVTLKGKTLTVSSDDGSFQKSYTFPTEVDSDKVNCEYKYGRLSVTLPKRSLDVTPVNIPVIVAQ